MNTVSRPTLIGAALVLVLMGCERTDAPAMTSSNQPLPNTSNSAAPLSQPSPPGTSLREAPGTTAGAQGATTLQQQTAPQERVTKEEESRAMPVPSRANDHSTTTLENSKSK